MSIIPMGVLIYFFEYFNTSLPGIEIENIRFVLIFVTIGVLVGFFAMRKIIKDIIGISAHSKQAIQTVLGEDNLAFEHKGENEIAVLTKSFEVVTNQLKKNIKNLELTKKTLQSVLSKVGSGLSSMDNIDSFLDLIIETITESLHANMGMLFLFSDGADCAKIKSLYGHRLSDLGKYAIKTNNGALKEVAQKSETEVVYEFQQEGLPIEIQRKISQTPVLLTPLILHEKPLGIIAICKKKKDERFNIDDMNLVKNVALQTAVAIENSKLNEDAEKTYFETISALALAVEAKDRYSRGHLDRVAKYATEIARRMKLGENDIKTLRDAARLHDIGKIGIYDDVLRKPGKLDEQERALIVKHTEIGESIIRPIRSLRRLCDAIRHHHEFLDGSGYPDGLRGEEVSLLARILTVSDIYDALTTDRPYRKASSTSEAKEILKGMKEKLDQAIVDILFEIVP